MKKIKMGLYGEPGVGKSVFACGAPRPFFICTDGNYDWLEDFGAKDEDHVQVFSWEQAKKEFTRDFSNYDTIVVDLLEDLFKMCEYEYCVRNKLSHISDQGYAKGYDSTRTEFVIEISKLLNLDKNVILIMHGITTFPKDRRGVEFTKYAPSNRLPDKVADQIEGRVRYFVRAYAATEEDAEGKLITNRYLSLSPDGTTEYGITRGLVGSYPREIPLDWNTFYSVVISASPTQVKPEKGTKAPILGAEVVNEAPVASEPEKSSRGRKTVKPVKESEETTTKEVLESAAKVAEALKKKMEEDIEPEAPVAPAETPVVEEKKAEPAVEKPIDNNDKLAAIKARLAALKNKQ